ncbi:hypothetical protein Ciccas_001055 [Cichlidogyrus casuarinus]|uniref:CST complex subunit STN1 n=1 Tax=Cichlidogyrus casuarinus TaxID=1844966 RepID=A0ABD2QL73_9PLAT
MSQDSKDKNDQPSIFDDSTWLNGTVLDQTMPSLLIYGTTLKSSKIYHYDKDKPIILDPFCANPYLVQIDTCYQLHKCQEGNDIYKLNNHWVRHVKVCGKIERFEEFDKRVVFLINDGTGTIPVTVFRNSEQENKMKELSNLGKTDFGHQRHLIFRNARVKALENSPSLTSFSDNFNEVDRFLTVRGRLNTYNGRMENHLKTAHFLKENFYSQPFDRDRVTTHLGDSLDLDLIEPNLPLFAGYLNKENIKNFDQYDLLMNSCVINLYNYLKDVSQRKNTTYRRLDSSQVQTFDKSKEWEYLRSQHAFVNALIRRLNQKGFIINNFKNNTDSYTPVEHATELHKHILELLTEAGDKPLECKELYSKLRLSIHSKLYMSFLNRVLNFLLNKQLVRRIGSDHWTIETESNSLNQ